MKLAARPTSITRVDESIVAPAANKRVGIREVAERAGVAIASVSRVLSDHPDASSQMRKRVLEAIAELGYQPDFLAKSLRTGASLMVGIVVSDICNPMMAAIVKAAELRLRAAGYTSLVVSSLGDPQQDTRHVEMLMQRRVDGLMIALTDEDNRATAEHLQSSRVPVLLLDRDVKGLAHGWAVRFDHAIGLKRGIEHLLTLGHRRIGLVNGTPTVRPSRQRVKALEQAAARYSEPIYSITKNGSFTAEHGYRATLELMNSAEPPTALISGNNQILIGVLRALRELNINVPAGLSLVTCDDVPMADFLNPRLATIRRDVTKMGHTAAELMLEALANGKPRSVTLSTAFDAAQSCAAPAGNCANTSQIELAAG